MRVIVNGEAQDVPDATTVADLVAGLGLSARRIAVEINRDILPRDRYASQPLRDGDAVEIVHFIGGG